MQTRARSWSTPVLRRRTTDLLTMRWAFHFLSRTLDCIYIYIFLLTLYFFINCSP